MVNQNQAGLIGQSKSASEIVDRIVTKHEAFFRLISETSRLTRDEQLELLETAIPSAKVSP